MILSRLAGFKPGIIDLTLVTGTSPDGDEHPTTQPLHAACPSVPEISPLLTELIDILHIEEMGALTELVHGFPPSCR